MQIFIAFYFDVCIMNTSDKESDMNGMIEYPDAYARATKRNILANARLTWTRNTPEHEVIDQFLWNGRSQDERGEWQYSDNFVGSLAKAMDTYGKLTPKQCEAVLSAIAKSNARKAEWKSEQAAKDAKSEWIGEIGQRVEITLTVNYIVELDSYYGTSWLFICVDDKGNKVIYKGTSRSFPNKGETATVVAAIKEHGVRDGYKQTIITRPKLKIVVDM